MEIPHDWLSSYDTPLLDRLHQQSESDPYKNKIHLSAYSGVTGVPATLFHHNEDYYIVIENGPFNEYESDILSWRCLVPKTLPLINTTGLFWHHHSATTKMEF